MIALSDIIRIGSLARTHGTQGEVQCRTINTYWDDAEADFIVLMLDHIPVPFRVTDWRGKGADLLFTLQGVTTEQQALRLIGSDVYMLRRDVAEADNDEMLCWSDLIGYTLNGCPIADIDDSTANILAQLSDGRLVPLHEDLILSIDHNKRAITMTLPEGL